MGKYAIFLVLALVFSLLTYSQALRNALLISNNRAVTSYSLNQAQNIAQGALMVAIHGINNGSQTLAVPESDGFFAFPYSDGFQEWEKMHGSYNLRIYNQADTLLMVEATGRFEETDYRVTAGLLPGAAGWNPVFDQAVHTENRLELTGSSTIKGHASTNSTAYHSVDLWWSTSIDSSLFIGPGGDPGSVVNQRNFQQGNVGEGVFVLPEEKSYPMPQFPPYPPKNLYGSSVYVQGSQSRTLNPNEYDGYYIPEISVQSNTTLTIHVGDTDRTLHVGSFDIQQGHVHFTGAGKVDLYVENHLTLGGSSTVNDNGGVNNLFMYYGGSGKVDFKGNTRFNGGIYAKTADVDLGGSNNLRGTIITGGNEVKIEGGAAAFSRVIYAPNAFVRLAGSATVYGAVIADSFEAVGNSHVIYDPEFDSELPDLEGDDEGNKYQVLFWN